ncbi:phenylalanine--tRNA ligase subunit beta [Synechococcus sp. UW179A]|uniref:phenylalanine--tRNA ligase subunit beta n=1 Tax=Synechococcus sp. UW179A TaxID=2575510 RepID=UPI000E0EE7CE|nr:phenylalanine--tRNA ligase subunit beta [Synechococcus sp. UW179A]
MRVSLSWLQDLVQVNEPADQLGERLSMAGFEVEELEDLSLLAQGVVVGEVLACDRHPNADKLSVCKVNVGANQSLQIVCGAKNVRAGIHVPVAMVGAVLPAVNLTIKAGELRGVSSEGMICSLSELGQSSDVDGIAILEDLFAGSPSPGEPVAPSLGLNDSVLELAITANRPDGLSMTGIAREVAALTGAPLSLPKAAAPSEIQTLATDQQSSAAMKDGGLYGLTEVKGIDGASRSPQWLQRRLTRAGVNPVNAVVDITNLVMLEQGQPLHAFDADALESLCGTAIRAADFGLRQAHEQETFKGLDGREIELDPRVQVVTCRDRAVAVAGVMGSAESGVTDSTRRIWLESALFTPASVRNGSRATGQRTDASSRYEKGLPREITLIAAGRALSLFREMLDAEIGETWVCAAEQGEDPVVSLRRNALHRLLGPLESTDSTALHQPLADAQVEACLAALGCELTPCVDGWEVIVPPSRRMDLLREVDLIEEVARLVGFDRFQSHLPNPLQPGQLTLIQQAERRLRQRLSAAGLQEITTLSLTGADDADPTRIAISNPLLAETSHLRTALWMEHLQVCQRNLQASQPGCWVFEIGNVFSSDGAAIDQEARLSGVICGERRLSRWQSSGKPQPLSYYEARGLLTTVLNAFGIEAQDRRLSDDGRLHPGRAASVVVEGRPLGSFGQLHPALCESHELPADTYLFDLELARLLEAATRSNRWRPQFKAYSTLPSSERDLAMVVPRSLAAGDLLQAIRKAGKPLLESVELIDRFEGGQLGSDQCSQAFRLRYRGKDSTLTDDMIQPVHEKVRKALVKQFQVQLRS